MTENEVYLLFAGISIAIFLSAPIIHFIRTRKKK